MNNKKRVIAIYLPQYHPFPENDEWWGKGFTEWTNVTKAKPLFPGHYQPHLPSDLGFYDLRVPEVREQQAQMARDAGIYGFCYYHYWFNGHQLMERPLNEVISSKKPNFPFMICWANENWTRAWDGLQRNVLIEQTYSPEDDKAHIQYLIKNVFNDPRYIKIDNKPVFAIYRSGLFPNIKQTLSIWREEAEKAGMQLYICRFESFGIDGKEYLEDGFDAAIDFQPLGKPLQKYIKSHLSIRVFNKINAIILNKRLPKIINYGRYIKFLAKQPLPDYKQYPCVSPMWDNTSRRKRNVTMLTRSTPFLYGKWLKDIMTRFKPYSNEENLVFINAWNEWAEGNHLEPDRKWGAKYLEETKKIIKETEE